MTCAMEVTKFISFSSNILVNGISDLDNRYFSLFGSFPSNSVGRPLNSSVLIKSDEEMLEENENKENKEKDVENVVSTTIKNCKKYLNLTDTVDNDQQQNCNILTDNYNSSFSSLLIPGSNENNNYDSFPSPKNESILPFLNEQQNNNSNNFKMDEIASTSLKFSVKNYNNNYVRGNGTKSFKKLRSISKPSSFLNASKLVKYRFPEPGWDEKLIQRIEKFRYLQNIQERVSNFRRHYKKGFRYRSKQRIPLRIQLLKYKCLDSIYGDLEMFMKVKKVLENTV